MCKKLISLLLCLTLVLGAVGVPVGAADGDPTPDPAPQTVTLLFRDKENRNFQPTPVSATIGRRYLNYFENVNYPSRTGYTPIGWYNADTNADIADTATISGNPGDEIILYVKWEANTYPITYSGYNNAIFATEDTTFGDKYKLPTGEPTRSGYKFAGWFTSANGGSPVTDQTVMTDVNQTRIYAHWTNVTYTVGWSYTDPEDKTTKTGSETVTSGTTIGRFITKPSKTGYDFVWKEGTTELSDNDTITKDMTLTGSFTAKKPTVTLNANGGTFPEGAVTSHEVTYGGDYRSILSDTRYKEPTRTGYNFKEWTLSSNGTNPVTADSTVANENNHTLYAQWTAKDNIALSFNVNTPKDVPDTAKPTPPSPTTVTYDQTYGDKLPTLAKLTDSTTNPTYDYTFDGWYEAAEDKLKDKDDPNSEEKIYSKIESSDVVTTEGHINLYARWTYTLTFDPNGGTLATTTQQFTTGKAMGTLPTPTRAGYSFEGWYNSANPGKDDNPFTANTIADPDNDGKKLYAKWSARDYTVTLDPNGGTLADNLKKITVKYDVTYPDIKTNNAPTRTGYTFDGWFTSAEGGTEVTKDTVAKVTNDNTVLYAHWKPKAYTLQLDYRLPDNLETKYEIPTLTKNQIKTGEKFLVTDLPSSPAAFKYNDVDFTFFDWYTSKGNVVNNDTELTAAMLDENNSTVTLSARWKYKVEFYNNTTTTPSTRPDSTVEFVTDTAYGDKLPAPERTGMTFAGWFPNSDGAGTEVTETSVADGNTFKLYAKWTTSNYRIVLNENGGTFSETQTIRSGYFDHNDPYGDFLAKYIPSPPAGHSFAGWFTEAEGGAEVRSTDKVTETRTLYAHWKPDQFKVTLDLNYTGSASTVKTVDYDTKLSDLLTPDPERTGYAFEGWFMDKACENAVDKAKTVQSNLTFYAKWIKAKRVNLVVGGGTLPEGVPAYINVYEGGTYRQLPEPTWLGCDFEGWYTSETGGTQVFASTTVPAESQIPDALYARWTPKKVRVSFNYNGPGTTRQPKEYLVGSRYALLPNAVWAGYKFMGWYTKPVGGDRITSDTIVSVASDRPEDLEITIYAHWGYTVAFEPGEGFGSMDSEVAEMNQPYTLPTCTFNAPDGMRFGGWAVGTPESPTQPGGSQYTVTRNLTLYATWTTAPIVITSSCTSGGSLMTEDGGVNSITVERGKDVTFIATANTGYVLKDLQVDGVSCNYTDVYTFRRVIEDHTIHAVFAPVGAPSYSTCGHGKNCPLSRYSDLNPNTWYHDGVHFCIDNVIMGGSSSTRFNPSSTTSRGEIAMSLWNHAGRPDNSASGPLRNTYPDVKPSAWYYQAVEWASGEHILTGYSNGRFGPNDSVTREQLVTILWRHAGSPRPRSTVLRFYDSSQVSSYAWEAMCWATEQQILQGRSAGYLVPKGTATRAEVATMIKNYLG